MAQEKLFEEKLKKWLESEGIYALGTAKQDMHKNPCGYWEKRWGGGKYIKAGMPDMHIVVNGISIEVELKAHNGKPSALQIQKLKQIDSAGCIALVVYPKDFEKFKTLITCIKKYQTPMNTLISQAGFERWGT